MNLYKEGNLAKSIAGHDKGQLYVIVKEEAEYVYVSDGRFRPLEKPKKKNKKHVQPIFCGNEQMPEMKRNEEIKRVIKLWCAGAAQE